MRVSEACARGTEVMSSPVLAAPNSEAKDALTVPLVPNQVEATELLPLDSNKISPFESMDAIFHTPLTFAISSVLVFTKFASEIESPAL